MMFYKTPNKRIIMRGGNGRFRKTRPADVGMGVCSKCGQMFVPDFSGLGDLPDPRVIRDRQNTCPACSQ